MYILTAEDNRSRKFKGRISSFRYFFLPRWKKEYYEKEIDMLERELFKKIEENRKKEDEKRVCEEMKAWERQRIEEAKLRDQLRKNIDNRARHTFNRQDSFFDEHYPKAENNWKYPPEGTFGMDNKDNDHKDHTHPLRDDHHHHRDHHNDHKASWGHDADWNHGDSHKSDSTHSTHTNDNHDSHSYGDGDSGGDSGGDGGGD